MRINWMILLVLMLTYACQVETNKGNIEQWKTEILEAEKNFAALLKKEGMGKAFLTFAADDAVLMRSKSLLIGKDTLRAYFENKTSKNLAWTPDFVDVAASGDLGYTYGKYTFSYTDDEGNPAENKGVFHTVWKRQKDGSWKFVWD